MTQRATGIHAENVNLLLRTMRQMGDDVTNDLRDASTKIATRFRSDIHGDTAQQSAAESAFKVYRDRVPKVGFSARAATGVSGGARAGELFFGAEFGSGDFRFPSRRKAGYFFYPTLRDRGEDYANDWFGYVTDTMTDTWQSGARRSR